MSLIGWAHARALAEHSDVHLVTRVANRAAILAAGLREGSDFTVIDLEAIERRILAVAARLRGGEDKGWTTLMALSLPLYLAFEREVWRRFGRDIAAGRFDVVHRITPVSPTMPSYVASRCAAAGVPFVLGPLNGGLPWPREFAATRRAEREWLSYLRAAHKLAPYYAASRRTAAAILVGSLDTYRQIPERYAGNCIYLPENGIDPARFAKADGTSGHDKGGRPAQALFVGRLVPYKGGDMAIEALAPLLREGRVTFLVVGDGPERPALEAVIARLDLGAHVTLAGRVPPDQVARHYAESDLMVFPSIREFGGGVVLEAMAMGLVPVVVDYGGPGELVTAATGVKVPLGSRDEIVSALRGAVSKVLDDPSGRSTMATHASQRVATHFTWARKAEQTRQVYEWTLDRARPKPDFHFLDGESDLSRR